MNQIDKEKIMNESTLYSMNGYFYDLYNQIMSDEEVYNSQSLIKNKNFLLFLKSLKNINDPTKAIKLFSDYGLQLRPVSIQKVDLLSDTFHGFEDIVLDSPSKITLTTHDSDLRENGRRVILSTLESIPFEDERNPNERVYTSINVDNRNPALAESQYNYQITHTQIDGPGTVEDPLNKDVLPMFFHLLTASIRNNSQYSLIRNLMLNELAERIMNIMLYNRPVKSKGPVMTTPVKVDQFLEDYQYISSILQAFDLLDKFTQGDDLMKENILQYIQAVFSRDLTLESLLREYKIDLDSSKKDLKTLKHI